MRVGRCLDRARSSIGEISAYRRARPAASGGVLGLNVATYDIGETVALIGFVADSSEAADFERRVRRLDDPSAGGWWSYADAEITRRGNAVVVRLDGDPETGRIVEGCLGGPRYAGDRKPSPGDYAPF